jgi:hypothetical protein
MGKGRTIKREVLDANGEYQLRDYRPPEGRKVYIKNNPLADKEKELDLALAKAADMINQMEAAQKALGKKPTRTRRKASNGKGTKSELPTSEMAGPTTQEEETL